MKSGSLGKDEQALASIQWEMRIETKAGSARSVCELTVSDVIESRLITQGDGKEAANHHAESRSRVTQKPVD
jgi:hypothetical protein